MTPKAKPVKKGKSLSTKKLEKKVTLDKTSPLTRNLY
jgi:hypothetical protein